MRLLDHLQAGTWGASQDGTKVCQVPEGNTAISPRVKEETKPEMGTVTNGQSSWDQKGIS